MSEKNSKQTSVETDYAEIAEKHTDPISGHRSLYAKVNRKAGEVIVPFTAKNVTDQPSYLTIQVNEHEHIELLPAYLECTNHSCDPNCFFDTTAWELIALKSIQAGEELTFFYPSTEWDMDQVFECRCGSSACMGHIQGARYLSDEIIIQYRFTDFINGKLALNSGINS